MAGGVALGAVFPSVPAQLGAWSVGSTSVPLAIGLVLMVCSPRRFFAETAGSPA